jgi:hypothetical protein
MKSYIFWDIAPYNTLKVNRHFGGIYCLNLQGRRISQARNQHENMLAACFMLVVTEQIGLSNKASDLYLGGIWFESYPGHGLS